MLGRLFSAAGHSRSPSSLESATEEQYTRNLLFSDAPLSSSPPRQASTAGLRSGNFDDHNGFALEAKDFRILLAQEDQERPSMLFDSNILRSRGENASGSAEAVPATRHERAASSAAPSSSNFGSQADRMTSSSLRSPSSGFHTRNRSSNLSGNQQSLPPSPSRDVESRDVDLLECMFGSSSATKSGIRTHIIKSGKKLSKVPSGPLVSPAALSSKTGRKPPLVRAQTSSLPSTNTVHSNYDTVLITRIFTVAPPEFEKETSENVVRSMITQSETSSDSAGWSKPPKLREKKTPAYAVSLVLQLPRQESPRPLSRQRDELHNSSPPPSSFGSDLQSSWTFLDALPPSLTQPRSNQQSTVDGNVDFVLRRWDAAVRHLSIIEGIAKEKIFNLLSQFDDISSGRKAPKEKRMQRINQKIIRLPPFVLFDDQDLCRKSFQAINLIRNALSTPSVRPLSGGHWLEEARIVARVCRQKGNERFFSILLTAFLGSHFEWISEIGRELHEKRLLLKWKSQKDKFAMRSRTVIVCEDRVLARRLVFLLSSFLFPGMLSLRSISSPDTHRSSAHSQHEKMLTDIARIANNEVSTSTSWAEEAPNVSNISGTTRRRTERKQSETSSLQTAQLSIPHRDSSFHKSSAGTTTTVTPNPSTPLAYMTSIPQTSDSYFPVASSGAGQGSAAAASLQRLRRSSSTASSMPSTWGSLLGSIWSSKQTSSTGPSSTTVPSEAAASTSSDGRTSYYQAPVKQLEIMAQEVGTADPPVLSRDSDKELSLLTDERKADAPPRLEVDEQDGVIDVDLNLPNPLLHSYASTPDLLPPFPTPLSTSTASLDDTRSFFSVRSSPRTSADHVNNVAGYLRQYHPDFVLQAVRSCSEKDVRESMAADLKITAAATSPESNYEEYSTLIADARNYSVKRLTLRRRIRPSTETTMKDSTIPQDEYSLESILSYDETLADAVDRALDQPSTIPSRLPSPSPSKRRHLRTVSTSTTTSTVNAPSPLGASFTAARTKEPLQPVLVPQRNRGQFIIDALKEVVGEVDRDLHSSKRSDGVPISNNPSISKPQNTEANVLREGVKRWLQGAEETSVW